jgi:hypothetical protein
MEEFMTPEFEHYVTMAAVAVALVTPVARALMAAAHGAQRMALKTATKSDDAIAMKFVFVTESLCGFVTKVSAFLPRLTIGKGVER